MNQSYLPYKKNPNKRAHDLNKEIKKGFATSIFQLSSMILFYFSHQKKKQQNKKQKVVTSDCNIMSTMRL